MKAALAQMNVTAGNTSQNIKKMKELILAYDKLGYDIIAFPELCISGYMVGDLWYEPDWIASLREGTTEIGNFIAEHTLKIAVIFGNIGTGFPGTTNQDGRLKLFNCAWMIQYNPRLDENIVESTAKTLLPNYRIFDDKRYFSAGDNFSVFPLTLRDGSSVRIGLEVCEDLWHEDYPINPTARLVEKGAEYIFNLSASPYSFEKWKARDRILQRTLKDVKTKGNLKNFFYVNCVGAQNNGKNILTFDGDSAIYNSDGEMISQMSPDQIDFFEEGVITFDTQLDVEIEISRILNLQALRFSSLITGIRHLDTFMPKGFTYTVGVSGGIDSAVVLCLLEQAVGKERIHALNLPTQYNTVQTQVIARNLCQSLDIPLQVINITPVVDVIRTTLMTAEGILELPDILEENIQAKVRGTAMISNFAALFGGVMTNNGNKLEIALGYATLYGDVNGAIAPLGDLLKTEVWDLARYLNEEIYKRGVIPSAIILDKDWNINCPPSAELKTAQVDPMKWGYHDALLTYIMTYNRGSISKLKEAHNQSIIEFCKILAKAFPGEMPVESMDALIHKYNLQDPKVFLDDLTWFLTAYDRAVFKRIQSPPIIIQSKTAFGYDLRESQLGPVHTSIQNKR